MFANIKNGQMIKKSFIMQPRKNLCAAFLNIMWNEGFILGYRATKNTPGAFQIYLKYNNGKPAISKLNLVTKPGQRKYCSLNQLWKIKPKKGLLIISTNKGLLSLEECKKSKVGGEPFIIIL